MSKTLFIINRVINPTSSSFEICDGWLCFIWKYALRLYDAIIKDKFNWSCSSCMNLSLSSSNWYLWWFWASLMTESDSNHRFVGTLCAIIALFNLCNKRYVTYPTYWDPKVLGQNLLCGNVGKFPIAKNGSSCSAHSN